MEKQKIEFDKPKWNEIAKKASKKGGLASVLALLKDEYWRETNKKLLQDTIAEELGNKLFSITEPDDFWTPPLEKALAFLTDAHYAKDFRCIIALIMDGPFSISPGRRSFRSRDFRYHLDWILDMLVNYAYSYYFKGSLKEQLLLDHNYDSSYRSFTYRLALELKNGNKEIIGLVRKAIYEDTTALILSRPMIEAIIISGNEELIDDLLRLLSAAKLQEGLRQQILESADKGSRATLQKILKYCLDENMFRFSSAIRAFDTWTGFGISNAQPSVSSKAVVLAYEVLSDEEKINTYLDSEDNIKAYLALWGCGCREMKDTSTLVEKLLGAPQHYRRILGWFFVTNSDNAAYSMNIAIRHLNEMDDELLAWATQNLCYLDYLTEAFSYGANFIQTINDFKYHIFPKSKEERLKIFGQLKEVLKHFGNRKPVFTGNPFPWSSISPDMDRVIRCMMSLAGYDMDAQLIEEFFDLSNYMSADRKQAFILHFLRPDENRKHRDYLFGMLNDRSVYVKNKALEILSKCKIDEEGVNALCNALRTKSSQLREAVISLLSRQPKELLAPAISRLLVADNENCVQAGVELLTKLDDNTLTAENQTAIDELRKRRLSTQTEILLNQLFAKGKEVPVYTKENGYGLYSPAAVADFLAALPSAILEADAILTEAQFKASIITPKELDALFARLDAVFTRHADYEYESILPYDDSKVKILFGDYHHGHFPLPAENGCRNLCEKEAKHEMIPFWDEFAEAFGEYLADPAQYMRLFYLAGGCFDYYFSSYYSYSDDDKAPWYLELEKKDLAPRYTEIDAKYKRSPYFYDFISTLYKRFDSHRIFLEAMKMYRSCIAIVGECNLGKMLKKQNDPWTIYGINLRIVSVWRMLLKELPLSDEEFAEWFLLEYKLENAAECVIKYGLGRANGLYREDYFRAFSAGLISRDVLLSFLANPCHDMPDVRSAYFKEFCRKYSCAREIIGVFIDRMVDIEAKRGELPTDVTKICCQIEYVEGMRHFCQLLAALGKANFHRGYSYLSNQTKQCVLSHLLKQCYPAKDDTPEALAKLLKETDISDSRLVDAAMYAPQWAGFAEQILGWKGLKCGVWFFHAHINESFSAEKETEVAIYSPITPQQFNDGAFDKNWFLEAYNQLGEARFQTLYRAAKYITDGGNSHRRSQLYTDAVLGRLDADALQKEIVEKRNQEKLRCYMLIPIKPGDTKETLRRYEFIQAFLKGSRQFGAQRRESEKQACLSAMDNLAVSAGYSDANHLTWQMESAKSESLKSLLDPKDLGGHTVRLAIDDNGDASVLVERDGKTLKSEPKELSKNEAFLELKQAVKDLREQKRRAKESLERSMTDCSEFSADELCNIMKSPVLKSLAERLLWVSGKIIGMICVKDSADVQLCLVDTAGHLTASGKTLRLAHPHDLKKADVWSEWMHFCYEKKIVQPFKQVFREYYPLTEDERSERTVSRRYAGNQVQPKRTVSLLKSRGWTVDYEEGLQKVFHKENLIVRMFAAADWFSPADIEAPTIETVEFFNRRNGGNVPLEEVPPVLFSETMRDLDLVVSVAHAGGVDPETSSSTVEMRLAIAGELVKLLKLNNVTWVGSHAKIKGKLANYSVHMGSGVVHAEGKGMIAIVTVHSQARGRIFLPFADDDPKTAEIMSKIILLSEDGKIKDPAITSQICS
ncbi:MAG: DUF4132 domain-containing protein [Victivallales bacterium]|nr:DUF4132 domain-containing protein [Victivallales bacterium]